MVFALIFYPLGITSCTNPVYKLSLVRANREYVDSLRRGFPNHGFLTDDNVERILALEDKYCAPRGTIFYMLWCESNFCRWALNASSGAYGLFQAIPSTRAWLKLAGADECALSMETDADQLELLDFYLSLFGRDLTGNAVPSCVYYGKVSDIDPYCVNLSFQAAYLRSIRYER